MISDTLSAVEIREAQPADADWLARLSAETFYETFADRNTEENMRLHLEGHCSPEKIGEELADKNSTFFAAFIEKKPVGYAKLRRSEIPEVLRNKSVIEIERLYVIKTMIGRKIGKLLMERCLRAARNERRDMIWLGVWEHNTPAIEFYRRFGFGFFGSHDFYVGNDRQTDLLMSKKVERS